MDKQINNTNDISKDMIEGIERTIDEVKDRVNNYFKIGDNLSNNVNVKNDKISATLYLNYRNGKRTKFATIAMDKYNANGKLELDVRIYLKRLIPEKSGSKLLLREQTFEDTINKRGHTFSIIANSLLPEELMKNNRNIYAYRLTMFFGDGSHMSQFKYASD